MQSVRQAVKFSFLLVLPLLFLVACMDDSPTDFSGDPPRAATIQDALHDDGNPFVFLKPPVVGEPSSDEFGIFNPNLQPVVEVCHLDVPNPGDCQILTTNDGANEDARYTVNGGPGGESVTLDAVAEEYQVQIHFALFDLLEGETYRIVTRVGAKELAFADVLVVSPQEMRNTDTGSNIVFTNDQKTVPWKVRIDEGALCWDAGETVISCTSSTVDSGEEETISLTSSDGEEVDLQLPSGWTATVDGQAQGELTLSIEEVPAADGDDPSCFAAFSLNDPETGEPANCYLVRADTDTDTDVTVDFGGSLPILAFCPAGEVLQAIADGSDGWIMTSVEEDNQGAATRTYANVEPASDFGGCPLPPPTVAFGDGIVGNLASALWTHVRPVMTPLLPQPLHAADIGFGGSLDRLGTIFFWSRTPTDLVVSPSSPSVAVGQTVTLTADPVFHEDATSGGTFNVEWSSSDATVASVDATTGVVTGVAASTAVITATAVNISDPSGDPVSGSVTVEVTAVPDLVVQTLTHSPGEPNVLDDIEFTAVVANQGQGPADPSTLMFKIGGETAGASATLFSVPALAPGETFTATRQLVLGVAQGYINTATADFNEDVPETDETNNTTQDSYTVTEAPDLVVSSMTHSPESPTTQDQITFTATVENVGSGPSRGTILMFKIGGETAGTPGTLFNVPALVPGQTFTVGRGSVLGVAQGYINTATADFNEDVPETDETNNTSTHSYTVTEPAVLIDGVLSSGEWDNASTFGFAANLPEGGTAPATFFWQVVGGQFYAAVRFDRSALDGGNTASIEFGPDPSGESQGVQDAFLVNGPNSFLDDVRLPSGAAPTDASQGGTNDGAGTLANDGTHTIYEMVHPLDSDDDLYDFSLSSGDQITLQLFLRIINNGVTADSTVPTPALTITIP